MKFVRFEPLNKMGRISTFNLKDFNRIDTNDPIYTELKTHTKSIEPIGILEYETYHKIVLVHDGINYHCFIMRNSNDYEHLESYIKYRLYNFDERIKINNLGTSDVVIIGNLVMKQEVLNLYIDWLPKLKKIEIEEGNKSFEEIFKLFNTYLEKQLENSLIADRIIDNY